MAKLNFGQRSTYATSSYRGGRQGFTVPGSGGKLSNGGKYITRRQTYYNVRTGLGLSGG